MMERNVTAKRWGVIVAAALGLVGWIALQKSDAQAPPPASAAPSAPSAPSAPTEPAAPPQDPKIAHITFTTFPPLQASVTWGTTRLGRITPQAPLVVERPRDSGPLDVIVRAAGFLPVHTRAHTFADSKLQVKMTRPDQKSTLLGYRAPIDAGTELPPDDAVSPAVPVPESPQWDMTQPPQATPATPPAGP